MNTNASLSYQNSDLFQVTPYHFSINNVEITVFDTPGLADGTGNEEEYLRKIKEKVIDFDVFIFCTEMNTTRFHNDDIKTVEKLTAAFGSQLWDHAVAVLTFANEVHPPPSKKGVNVQEFFEERLRLFKKKIQDVILTAGVAGNVVITVPFVAAGDLSELRLLGITNWLTAFWIATFKSLNRRARSAFLLASIDRFNYSSSEQEVPRRDHPLRRSLPPHEVFEGNQLQRQMQRRSFQGFERGDRQYGGHVDADSDVDHRHFKSYTLPVTRSKTPPTTKPKPKRMRKRNDTSTIDLDESSSKEIVIQIVSEVSKEASTLVGDWLYPGTGRLFGAVFSRIMTLLKRWLCKDSLEENSHVEKEHESDKEED